MDEPLHPGMDGYQILLVELKARIRTARLQAALAVNQELIQLGTSVPANSSRGISARPSVGYQDRKKRQALKLAGVGRLLRMRRHTVDVGDVLGEAQAARWPVHFGKREEQKNRGLN
jgi:hypothetical protein